MLTAAATYMRIKVKMESIGVDALEAHHGIYYFALPLR
jgi:hypothetical protein